VIVRVNVRPEGYGNLRVLFPDIQFALRSPVYARRIFTLFSFRYPERVELVLEQSDAGISLDQVSGVVKLLDQVGYFTGKAVRARFDKAIREGGLWFGCEDVEAFCYYCMYLRWGGHDFVNYVDDSLYWTDVLVGDLYSRLKVVEGDPGRFLLGVLRGLEAFGRSGSHMKPYVREKWGKAVNRLNRQRLRDFVICGKVDLDASFLAACFE